MGTWCNDVKVSPEAVDFYNTYGYCVVDGVMSNQKCDELLLEAEKFVAEDHAVVLNIHRKSSVFLDIICHPVIVNIVRDVQAHPIVALNSQFLFKRCNTPYGKQSWTPHQECSYLQTKRGDYMVAHLSLSHSDPDNGGLIFYPRSHNEEILPFLNNKSWREDFDKDGISHPGLTIKDLPEKYRTVDMYIPKGSLCLMHGSLIHGSHPNRSADRSRPQYSMGYLNKGAEFNPGKTSIKEVIELE